MFFTAEQWLILLAIPTITFIVASVICKVATWPLDRQTKRLQRLSSSDMSLEEFAASLPPWWQFWKK